jgi:vancomycin resistance protein YoaR
MKFLRIVIPAIVLFIFTAGPVHAQRVILKTDFKIWTLDLNLEDFANDYEKTFFSNLEIDVPEDQTSWIEPYLERKVVRGYDLTKLIDFLETKIAPAVFREREDVKISEDKDGKIVFEGNGFYGRKLDSTRAALLLREALEKGLTYVNLPLVREDPVVTVESDKLKELGIKDLFSSGETDFSNSPVNRISNIKVGLSKFSGHIIKPGETFVFGEVLGPVEVSTGFKKELVIKGDRTEPELGGGLCQVSTTAYRAVLAAGFPVTERHNHSYAVSYYDPIGLDSTVYPPTVNLRFINDSPASILIQTLTLGNKAYYNFYGTKDDRKVYMIGPYYSARTSPPAKRVEYSTKLAPGEVKILGHPVPGLKSSWYRQVVYSDTKKEPYFEGIHSKYQARPDFRVIGTASEAQATPADASMMENGY